MGRQFLAPRQPHRNRRSHLGGQSGIARRPQGCARFEESRLCLRQDTHVTIVLWRSPKTYRTFVRAAKNTNKPTMPSRNVEAQEQEQAHGQHTFRGETPDPEHPFKAEAELQKAGRATTLLESQQRTKSLKYLFDASGGRPRGKATTSFRLRPLVSSEAATARRVSARCRCLLRNGSMTAAGTRRREGGGLETHHCCAERTLISGFKHRWGEQRHPLPRKLSSPLQQPGTLSREATCSLAFLQISTRSGYCVL